MRFRIYTKIIIIVAFAILFIFKCSDDSCEEYAFEGNWKTTTKASTGENITYSYEIRCNELEFTISVPSVGYREYFFGYVVSFEKDPNVTDKTRYRFVIRMEKFEYQKGSASTELAEYGFSNPSSGVRYPYGHECVKGLFEKDAEDPAKANIMLKIWPPSPADDLCCGVETDSTETACKFPTSFPDSGPSSLTYEKY